MRRRARPIDAGSRPVGTTGAFALARRADEPEYLDRPSHDPAELAGNLDDLRRVNRWLGGNQLTILGVQLLVRGVPRSEVVTIVDVGTGGADVPEALAAWAAARHRAVDLVAIDLSPEILALARRRVPECVRFAVADGRHLPLADAGVDLAICSLVLHHFAPDDAVDFLREMRRVARRGIVVNDLVRSRVGYLGALALGRVATRNPLTRHDAPLSVRRAYTGSELTELAERADLGPVRFFGIPGYRTALVAGGRR